MAGPLDADIRLYIQLASVNLRRSLDVIVAALTGGRDGVYIRSSALFDQAGRRIEERSGLTDPARLAVHDLELIDRTLARMADFLGLAITDYDATFGGAGGMRGCGLVHGPSGQASGTL
jgi:hypothetical protein